MANSPGTIERRRCSMALRSENPPVGRSVSNTPPSPVTSAADANRNFAEDQDCQVPGHSHSAGTPARLTRPVLVFLGLSRLRIGAIRATRRGSRSRRVNAGRRLNFAFLTNRGRTMSRLRSIYGRLTATLLLSLALPAVALANAKLISATPAANGMATPPPTELRLKFSKAIEIKFTKVKVTGPGKRVIETGAAKLEPADNTVLIVPLTSPLPDGKYTVEWRARAHIDGHTTTGSYGFDSMK